ncbi:MAG: RsmE family RNA methyltransferase [bacterium]|nr:RsmE family RNA methyltransferase [bacterium]
MVTQQHGEFVYVGDARISDGRITLSADEQHHLLRVRRARNGDEVMATDGHGTVYRATVVDQFLEIRETLPEFCESALQLHVICGCLQGDSAREAVASAVQLGARSLTWIRMRRSQESFSDSKLDKLRRVAVQSTKQAGRARLIEQTLATTMQDAWSGEVAKLWVAHPSDNPTDHEPYVDRSSRHILIIGPEGGFDAHELGMLFDAGATPLPLGACRLRSEVALAAGLVHLRSRAGEL